MGDPADGPADVIPRMLTIFRPYPITVHTKTIKRICDPHMNQIHQMSKSIKRTYSRYTREASTLLGSMIRTARLERKLTAQEVADRAGISRGLLQRIEKGDLKCEIGVVFEVAAILGIQLFDADETGLTKLVRQTEDKLALLPKSVRKKHRVVRDDF